MWISSQQIEEEARQKADGKTRATASPALLKRILKRRKEREKAEKLAKASHE